MAEAALKELVGGTSGVVLRPATAADVPQMIELVRVVLGEGSIPRTEAFWRWKHEQNPFGRSPAMVAEVDGRIVSLRVFLRWRWRFGGRELAAVRPVDTATHPDWRRRGLFERLTRALVEAMRDEGVAFLFNTPNARSGQGYRKLGWRIVGRPAIWVRPVRPIRLLAGLAGRQAWPANADPRAGGGGSATLLEAPDLAGFLRSTTRCIPRLVTDISAAYLAWRYRDCPGISYGAAGTFDRASGALLIFRRAVRRGLRELRLSDLFVTDDRASQSKVKDVVRSLTREEEIDLVTARAGRGTAEAKALVRAGFVPVPRIGPTLAVRPIAAEAALPPIDRLSAWSASIGDLEVF